MNVAEAAQRLARLAGSGCGEMLVPQWWLEDLSCLQARAARWRAEVASAYRDEGWSLRRVVEEFGCSYWAARQALAQEGVAMRPRGGGTVGRRMRKVPQPVVDAIVARGRRGATIREIMAELDGAWSYSTVRRVLVDEGVPRRTRGGQRRTVVATDG